MFDRWKVRRRTIRRIRKERAGYEWAKSEIANGVPELDIEAHVTGSGHPFDVGAKEYLHDLHLGTTTTFPTV